MLLLFTQFSQETLKDSCQTLQQCKTTMEIQPRRDGRESDCLPDNGSAFAVGRCGQQRDREGNYRLLMSRWKRGAESQRQLDVKLLWSQSHHILSQAAL